MVTFPRPLPDVQYTLSNFEIERYVSSSLSGGRLTNVVEYADPRWVFTATTRRLVYSDGQMVNAWFDSFRGGLRSALIRSPHYCQPRAHIGNKGPEQKAGTLSAITNQNTLSVTNVNAGLVLSPGDFVSLQWKSFYAMGRVVGASGTSTVRTIEIEPKLPAYVEVGATVRFDRAELLMRPSWDDVNKWTRDNPTFTMKFTESRL